MALPLRAATLPPSPWNAREASITRRGDIGDWIVCPSGERARDMVSRVLRTNGVHLRRSHESLRKGEWVAFDEAATHDAY